MAVDPFLERQDLGKLDHLACREVEAKTSSALMIGGGLGFLIYYAVETYFVWVYFNMLSAAVFLITLPFLGFATLKYVKKVKERWRMWNFSLTLLTNRHIVKKLKLERRGIIRRLDEFKEDYLKVINS